MTTNMIPFEASKLPSFLAASTEVSNADLTAHVGGGGFPVLSIKGKVFAMVKDGERTVVTRPDDPDEAASSLEVVLLKANPNLSKVYYAKAFEEGENAKPDCFSNDGTKPDPEVATPQCKSCAACPHNVFGSGTGGKGKACSDSRRMAVSPAGQINEPMLLRIPPATLKVLGEYGKMLNNRGVPYSAVVTKIRFEREESTPKLKFEAVRFLSEEEYAEVQETIKSETVENILGKGAPVAIEDTPTIAGEPPKAAVKAPAKAPKVTTEEVAAAVAVGKAKEESKATVKAAKAEEAEAAEQTPTEKKTAKMADDLDSLLADLDD